MRIDQKQHVEELQRLVASTVALNPAGRNLLLIGGFRFRFLDGSVRISDDIDYHWSGDLADKQAELLKLLERKLLPDVRRRWGYEGHARAMTSPEADSPAVRSVDLAFWKPETPFSRIEIPVEITRIVCADPIAIRTASGTVYPTTSNADMIESKIIALFGRSVMRHRDLVDLFLFQDQLLPDSSRRLAAKCRTLGISEDAIHHRIGDFRTNGAYHARSIQAVIDSQLDPEPAARLREAGGGGWVLQETLRRLEALFLPEAGHARA